MRHLLSLALIALASPALAQQYLPQADMATCLTRSAAQCQALGCRPGTTYWWSCQPLTDGTAAVRVEPSGDFAATHPRGPGLSAGERAALLARAAMSTKLPDILSSATWLGKISAAKQNAITTWAGNHPGAAATIWNAVKGGADVDLSDARVQALIAAIRAAGAINDADVTALDTPQATP